MQSFHNDPAVKQKYLDRVEAHRKADELIRGTGWDGHRGCAVGCTLEAYDHARYPIELGVPEWLARLEDTIFEGMSKNKAMSWPGQFLAAIPLGVTEQQFERNVKAPFLLLVLERVLTTFDNAKYPNVTAAIQGSIALWRRQDIGSDDFNRAARAAEAAARAAEAAAWAAAAAEAEAEAARAAAAWAAEAAARAAEAEAEAARAAAWAAAEAARAAAWAAWAAAAAEAEAARAAAAAENYEFYAKELLKLLREAGQ